MKAFALLAGLLLLLSVPLLAWTQRAANPPLPTVPEVDLRRYAGEWYEVARLPNWFQRANESATAEYLPMADGGVRVINTATDPKGKTRSIRGEAMPVPGSHNARLRVKFAAWMPASKEGNYWIIALDRTHYGYAMVGTPDRKYLWILARTPKLESAVVGKLRARAQELGFAADRLYWDQR